MKHNRSPSALIPRPGTPEGDRVRDEFQANLLAITGDTRMLVIPGFGDTTTSTDKSLNARTVIWDADISSRLGALGSGVTLEFDGTDDEGDTPDTADLTFGDGSADQAFSILALLNPDVVTSRDILARYDITTGSTEREWFFTLNASGFPTFELWDESAGAKIGRQDATALTAGAWTLLATTYDATEASTGINIYKDGAVVDDTDNNSGSYTAMEDRTVVTSIGYSESAAGAKQRFWDGKMTFIAVVAKELSASENWAIKTLVNSYYDLDL